MTPADASEDAPGTAQPGRVPVSAPTRVLDRLSAAPDGPVRVLHRGAHAVYAEVGGWCVGVADPFAARVPCALQTARVGLTDVDTAHVRAGVLHLGGRPLVVGRFLDVQVPRICVAAERAAPLRVDDVRALVGVGDGLTPYGDDLLCGWLAVHRAAGVPTPEVDEAVRALAYRTTLLSATLLDCALHGEVLPEFAAWLRVLGTPSEPLRAASLEAVGHTSGRGLLQGARRALSALRPVSGAAA